MVKIFMTMVSPLLIPGVQGIEWVILIAFVILILFGAKKLPELARSIGKATGEFQRGRQEIEKQLKELKEETTENVEEAKKKKLIKVAQDLGIDVTGKTEEKLREEIMHALNKEKD